VKTSYPTHNAYVLDQARNNRVDCSNNDIAVSGMHAKHSIYDPSRLMGMTAGGGWYCMHAIRLTTVTLSLLTLTLTFATTAIIRERKTQTTAKED